MKFQNANPTQTELPATVYAIENGNPPAILAVCVDQQTAEAIQASAFPTSTIVPGTLTD